MKPFKNVFSSVILFLFLIILAPALALADGFYVSGGGGASYFDNSSTSFGETSFNDLGYAAAAAIGYKKSFFKVEGQWLKVGQDNKTQTPGSESEGSCRGYECAPVVVPGRNVAGSGNQDTFMFNAYLVAPWDFFIRPYAGGGIGLTDRYQYKGGLEFVFTPRLSGYTEYTYFDQHGETGDQFQAVTAGVTYYFN